MTLAVVSSVRSSLAARLDMAIPSLKSLSLLYTGNRRFVTATQAIKFMHTGYRGHKKASRVAPARGCASHWGLDQDTRDVTTPASGWCRPRGSRRSTD